MKESNFCRQLDKILIQDELYRSSYTYSEVTEIFSILLEKVPAMQSKKNQRKSGSFHKKGTNQNRGKVCKVQEGNKQI